MHKQHNFSPLDTNKIQVFRRSMPFTAPGNREATFKGTLPLGLHPRVADKSFTLVKKEKKKVQRAPAYTFTLNKSNFRHIPIKMRTNPLKLSLLTLFTLQCLYFRLPFRFLNKVQLLLI